MNSCEAVLRESTGKVAWPNGAGRQNTEFAVDADLKIKQLQYKRNTPPGKCLAPNLPEIRSLSARSCTPISFLNFVFNEIHWHSLHSP